MTAMLTPKQPINSNDSKTQILEYQPREQTPNVASWIIDIQAAPLQETNTSFSAAIAGVHLLPSVLLLTYPSN